jgi:hypothetical protein
MHLHTHTQELGVFPRNRGLGALQTFGSFDANLLESFRLFHWPNNCLDQLLNLFIKATNVGVLLRRLLINLHGFDSTIVLSGESIENKVRVLVDPNKIAGLQFLVVNETYQRKEDGLSRRCLDYGGFSDSGCVKIDICTLLSGLLIDIQVKNLDNISNQIRELSIVLLQCSQQRTDGWLERVLLLFVITYAYLLFSILS